MWTLHANGYTATQTKLNISTWSSGRDIFLIKISRYYVLMYLRQNDSKLRPFVNKTLQQGFNFGLVLCRTNTVNVIWRLSNFNGGRRPQVPLRGLFQARADAWVEPPTSNSNTSIQYYYYRKTLRTFSNDMKLFEEKCHIFNHWSSFPRRFHHMLYFQPFNLFLLL